MLSSLRFIEANLKRSYYVRRLLGSVLSGYFRSLGFTPLGEFTRDDEGMASKRLPSYYQSVTDCLLLSMGNRDRSRALERDILS